jgi:hypothetical protein
VRRQCAERLHSGAEMHQMREGMHGVPPFWCRNAPDAGGHAWSASILVQKCTRCWRACAELPHSGAEMHQMRRAGAERLHSGAEMHQMREGRHGVPPFWCRNAPDAGGLARSASILVQKCTRCGRAGMECLHLVQKCTRCGRVGAKYPYSGAEMHQMREGMRGAPPFWCRNAPDTGKAGMECLHLVQKCTSSVGTARWTSVCEPVRRNRPPQLQGADV